MVGSVANGEADENGNHGGNPSNNSSLIIPLFACLFNRKSRTILEFGYACIKETVSVTGNIHNRDIAR